MSLSLLDIMEEERESFALSKRPKIYFPNKLPWWLAIGPICWRATYREGWVWLPRMTMVQDNMFVRGISSHVVSGSHFIELPISRDK